MQIKTEWRKDLKLIYKAHNLSNPLFTLMRISAPQPDVRWQMHGIGQIMVTCNLLETCNIHPVFHSGSGETFKKKKLDIIHGISQESDVRHQVCRHNIGGRPYPPREFPFKGLRHHGACLNSKSRSLPGRS